MEEHVAASRFALSLNRSWVLWLLNDGLCGSGAGGSVVVDGGGDRVDNLLREISRLGRLTTGMAGLASRYLLDYPPRSTVVGQVL